MIQIVRAEQQRDTHRIWFRCVVAGCDLRGDATVPSRGRAREFVALLNEAHSHADPAADTKEETP